ncbi:MAG: class I SAM-dependent methyltransferase [Terracidiphilus sp.]|nr:class I SAM-dependent methyltransferase [Terracidiphilus sp.]
MPLDTVSNAIEEKYAQWFTDLREEFIHTTSDQEYLRNELEFAAKNSRFSFYDGLNPMWLMSNSERAAMFMILSRIKPQIIIEVGCRFAGSTFIFSQFAKHVYTIDIDPAVLDRCRPLENVTVLLGNSREILPGLIDKVNQEHGGWDFALVDGDHSTAGVCADLNIFLNRRPLKRAFISMHDSFNPECRKGILAAEWDQPWVQTVDVDFTPGDLKSRPDMYGEMWGGLALCEVSPQNREGPLSISADQNLSYEISFRFQNQLHRIPLQKRLAAGIKRRIRRYLHL